MQVGPLICLAYTWSRRKTIIKKKYISEIIKPATCTVTDEKRKGLLLTSVESKVGLLQLKVRSVCYSWK